MDRTYTVTRDGAATDVRAELALAWVLIVAGLALFCARQLADLSEVFRLALPDNDDMMRLLAVRDLLAGQGWFDLTQYRYLPPEGVAMHWSRLIDLPLALAIRGLSPVVGPDWAERIVVAFWPLLMFVVYIGVIGRTLWWAFGPLAAGAAVFVAGQMVVFHDVFAAGRIDHHNVQIILTSAAAISVGLMQDRRRSAIAAGILIGLSLAIGLETLPFVALIALAYPVFWLMDGEANAAALSRFGASLAATVLLASAAQTSPSLWLTPACDSLSGPWLLLTAGGGAMAVALSAGTRWLTSWRTRLVAAAVLGASLVLAFVLLFPTCLEGPYQIVPEPYRSIWIDAIGEARPFYRFVQVNPTAALASVIPLGLGALAVTLGVSGAARDKRAFLLLLAGLLWLGSILAEIQIRTLYISAGFLPLAVAWLTAEVAGRGGRSLSPLARSASAVCLVLMLSYPWIFAVTAFDRGRAGAASGVAQTRPCQDPAFVKALDDSTSGVVLAQVNLGPSVLLHTTHSIIVAGFHRAPQGIVAGIEVFGGDEDDMKRVVDQYDVDILAICPAWLPQATPEPFAKRLAEGQSVPWLEPLPMPDGPLMAWRVVGER
jgi:hypothetical protein